MPNTIFVALQCCQCSMMQVKQQKKSSNKWTCVVCNQKQSVRKVFAQGNMARDLRPFVQSFNMSLENQNQAQTVTEECQSDVERQSDQNRDNWRKPHIDWAEYLENEEENKQERDREREQGIFEPKMVTEMPSKKPMLNKYSKRKRTESGGGDGVRDQVPRKYHQRKGKPTFKCSDSTAQDAEEGRSYQPTVATVAASKWMAEFDGIQMAKTGSKCCDYRKEEKEQKPHMQTAQKSSSKWSSYLTPDEDDQKPDGGSKVADHTGEWSNGIFETHDQIVDDDIHPDFM